MKTLKSLLAVLGVLFLVGSFAGATDFDTWLSSTVSYEQFAETESGAVPVFFERYGLNDPDYYANVGLYTAINFGGMANDTGKSIFGGFVGIRGKCNYTSSDLPEGLVLNKKYGVIYGKPTKAGFYRGITITAKNSYGEATQTFNMKIADTGTYTDNQKLFTTQDTVKVYIGTSLYDYNYFYNASEIFPDGYEDNGSAYFNVSGSRYGKGVHTLYGYSYERSAGFSTTVIVLNPEDLEGEWDFTTPDTGDTGTTITVSDETPVMAFAATQEVTTDDEEVVADLEVTAPAVAIPTVADVLRGNVTQFNYDLYVMLEIGDGVLFITDTGTSKDLTGDTKEFTKKIKSGKHRIFDLQMTPVLRLALKGVKIRWYAGCVSNEMEVCGVIATATTEFK